MDLQSNNFVKSKSGYLNVKLSLKLGPIVGQYKVWSKRWICFETIADPTNDGIVSVNLFLFRHEKSENIIYCKNFKPQNTSIFRCRSRTQNYSFTICDHNEAIIHLSANSETESQLWIQWFRDSLWTPNPLMQFDNLLKHHFYVSIIDNEYSHRSGLLGAYGYLQVSSANIVLIHCQTGHVIHSWLLSVYSLRNPFDKILQITRNSCESSYSGLKYILLYCEDANEVIARINRNKELENYAKCVSLPEGLSLGNSSFSVKSINNFRNKIDRNLRKSSHHYFNENVNTFRIRNAKEIPEIMLNCSITSTNDWKTSTNEINVENIYSEPFETTIESDIYEEIDKIYEEIANQDTKENINYSDLYTNSKNSLIYSGNKRIGSHVSIAKYDLNYNMGKGRDDRHTDCCDMFSQIVRQMNTSLLNSRIFWLKSMNRLEVMSGHESDNSYCEMRPVLSTPSISGCDNLSVLEEYVEMKSLSI